MFLSPFLMFFSPRESYVSANIDCICRILADVNSLYHSEQPSPDDHPGRKDVFCLPRAPYEHIHNPDTSLSHDTPAADPVLAHSPRAVQCQVPQTGHENLCIDSENWGYSDQGDGNIEGIALPEEGILRQIWSISGFGEMY